MLFGSQVGFVTAYTYFISSQMIQTITQIGNYPEKDPALWDFTIDDAKVKWYFLPICFAIFYPLVLVRKITVFAKFHLFGDIMIILAIVVMTIDACISISNNGWNPNPDLKWINTDLWPNAIGFAVYSFEGVGVILPIYDITENKQEYYKLVLVVCAFITLMYVIFGELCVWTYSNRLSFILDPLITGSMPDGPVSWIIKILFMFNLFASYPLVIYPANMVVESYLYSGWPKSRKRQMCKNLNRAILVFITVLMAIVVYAKMDRLLSITGGLTCIPIAFIYPAMFHYKACAETKSQKICDALLISVGIGLSVFCTIYAIINWNA